MKGVINKGIQELIERTAGLDIWLEIQREVGFSDSTFSLSDDYPDQLTLDLISVAARRLSMSQDEVMVAFGEFWISNTGRVSYPSVYALAGTTVREFLNNIGTIHQLVTTSLMGASPPLIQARNLESGVVELRYESVRNLCPVVHGLILGAGRFFGEPLQVEQPNCTRRGDAACVFEVGFC